MPLPPVPRTRTAVPETRTPIGPITVAAARTCQPGATPAPGSRRSTSTSVHRIEYPTASAEPPLHVAASFDGSPTDASLVPDLELVEFAELGAPIGDDMAPTVTVLEESGGETIDVGLPADLRDASKPCCASSPTTPRRTAACRSHALARRTDRS